MEHNVQEKDFLVKNHHDHEAVVHRLRENMPTDEIPEALAALFRCFADPTRMKILYALSQTELCVCALAEFLDMTHSAISHQLCKLRKARLVACRKEGKMMIYSLADSHVKTLISVGFEHWKEENT